MNWVLEHLQLIIVIAGAVAAWLNQRKKAADAGDEDGRSVVGDDDQTRRIQEEIRRKIAERRGQEVSAEPAAPPVLQSRPAASPEVAPRPVAREMPASLRDLFERRIEEARRREEAAAHARSLAEEKRNRQAEEQAEVIRRQETESRHRQVAAAQKEAGVASAAAAEAAGGWLRELRNPSQVRRAVVLREILGPPVGLR